MLGVGAIATQMWVSARPISIPTCNSNSMSCSSTNPSGLFQNSSFSLRFCVRQSNGARTHFSPRAAASSSSVGSSEYTEEPETKVKFQKSLSLPGCSSSLSLLGTGFREKKFAMIGVKVYAAGLYVDGAFLNLLKNWKGQSAPGVEEDSTLFNSMFEDPFEKSLQIVMVRDIDGKTFWDALNESITPRIKDSSPEDESALSKIRSTIQGKPLNRGTSVFLTWLNPSKMLVSISSSGLPSSVDATVESPSVPFALFDVFFGDSPVSPTLKSSVVNGLGTLLK